MSGDRSLQLVPASPGSHVAGIASSWVRHVRYWSTGAREVLDITDHVRQVVEECGLQNGFVQVHVCHTTAAVFLNESQPALIEDVSRLLAMTVRDAEEWRHNDREFSDCDRGNAAAHLRALLLGAAVLVPVENGELSLGQYQRVLLAELDGPRERLVSLHLLGV